MRLPIHGWVRTSLIDYPGHISSSIFLAHCNFRCPYCHNADLVLVPPETHAQFSEVEILEYLSRHRTALEGICLSGGEPLLQPDVPAFLRCVRSVGLKIKVDTNGSCPEMLAELLREGLVDYVAMDVKGPLEKVSSICRTLLPPDRVMAAIERSACLLREHPVDYEFRTTVVPGLLTEKDFDAIGQWLCGSRRLVLQQFRPGRTLDPSYSSLKPLPGESLEEIARRMKMFFEECTIRGTS